VWFLTQGGTSLLDLPDAEGRYASEPAHDLPDRLFVEGQSPAEYVDSADRQSHQRIVNLAELVGGA
jgi:hypothetical protein